MLIKTIASGTGDILALDPDPMLILWGFSHAETASSAATAEINIYHGKSSDGQMLTAPINFAADGYGYPSFFPQPISCPNGVYVERVSGETTVIIYYDYQ
jgi:hypothetical protein